MVRLSLAVPESVWRKLRHLAEQEREGRPSVNALLNQIITDYLKGK